MRVLVAEDERITRATLTRTLEAWGHTVTAAADGAEALRLFEVGGTGGGGGGGGGGSGGGGAFDIVLTDWEMPGLSGLELIERLRARPDAGFMYIIMLTGRSDKADVVRGIEAGADDFVSKPFDREELRVRLLAGERIVRLERTLSRQNHDLRAADERIRADLRAAARVQSAMLPRENIATPRARTAWLYVPTDELAGDGIGLHLVEDRYLVAYVLDVSGHGVPAALLSVSVMHAMALDPAEASLLRTRLPASDPGTVRSPELVAAELNRRFPYEKNDGRFVTLVLCVLDTHTGRVRFARAGHGSPILLREGQSVEVPDVGGMPLCIAEGEAYPLGEITLMPGDRFCLTSDGFTEQLGAKDGPNASVEFGEARLTTALARSSAATIEQAAAGALDALTAWAGERRFKDDVSLAVVEWLGPG